MAIDVNPPPQPQLPKEFANNKPVRDYFKTITRFFLQIYQRTGGEEDLIDQANTNLEIRLSTQIEQLRKEIEGLPEFTMDTTGFTMDSSEFTMDKVIA